VLTETESHPPVERGPGGWLRARRHRLALWIAAAEGVVVAVSHDLTKWTVVALAALAGVAWVLGRNSRSNGLRQGLWILVVSQLIAVVLVLFAVFFKWLLILGLVACAVVGLAILWFDRR
jgi:membrane-associated HD superfamily phosphohydrolase